VNVLVMHGPNLNLLGEREPSVYGKGTLEDLNAQLITHGKALKLSIRTFQSNSEGALIDTLHAERRWMGGLVINPGAFTHYSYSLREAIAAVGVRAIEVHLSDISKREKFRRHSVIQAVCERQISGKGFGSYLEALEVLSKAPRSVKRRR
jgi:3-dehydroquinate dehydratase-2